ncbi:MAG: flagellar biosynthesis/type III secretory pathway chaperone [Enterobacterales bacterium]|jgi:flagellar biosynthesis/type III secretory pathway chaperone
MQQNNQSPDLNTQQSQKLSQLLIQEANLSKSLLELMLEEKILLEENQADKLVAITTQKATCLDQIEFVSRNRAQLLLALSSKPTTVDRMKDFISKQTTKIQIILNRKIDTLEIVLEECKHQNSVNGMIISMSQRNVQRNLNIIKGIEQDSMTYTQKGQTTALGQQGKGLKV